MSLRHHLRRAPVVSADEAVRLVEAGALVVDVRGEREFRRQHVPGSVHVPLAELEERAVDLPDDRVLVTSCTGGLLSRGAANLLVELGFDAVSLGRGLVEWRAAGLPLVGDRSG
ncbi:rhodanese-like domain-containing protein [Cellulomonas endophytica]|uniref:rhodanese-like domain-containing protein n=1 Tax=Cellulomonas endophytica TaxID=2494735 RepID=UPI00101150FB|nr:rhodanese-like domain-containing protein [Cellulomonas endophytica]